MMHRHYAYSMNWWRNRACAWRKYFASVTHRRYRANI